MGKVQKMDIEVTYDEWVEQEKAYWAIRAERDRLEKAVEEAGAHLQGISKDLDNDNLDDARMKLVHALTTLGVALATLRGGGK